MRRIAQEGDVDAEEATIRRVSEKMKLAMRHVWGNTVNDVFDVGYAHSVDPQLYAKARLRTEEDVARVDRLAEEIGTIQGLKNAFDPILSVILMALDSPAVFMRSKALRALGQLVTTDPDILGNVRHL